MSAQRPIGVFDSGLGGLTVLNELVRQFPNENFIYLGDTARIPYGTKSANTVRQYSQKNIEFLIDKDVKAIVVACNSASSVIDDLKCPIPLVGMIHPGAFAAAAITKNKKVGVMATRTTVAHRKYLIEINKANPEVQVFQQSCPLLVPLVEEAWDNDPITNLIVYRYLTPLISSGIDTLILGCTHYPILIDSIRKVTGIDMQIINSGEAAVRNFKSTLEKYEILNTENAQPDLKLFTTDNSETYQALASRLLTHLPISSLELVNL